MVPGQAFRCSQQSRNTPAGLRLSSNSQVGGGGVFSGGGGGNGACVWGAGTRRVTQGGVGDTHTHTHPMMPRTVPWLEGCFSLL